MPQHYSGILILYIYIYIYIHSKIISTCVLGLSMSIHELLSFVRTHRVPQGGCPAIPDPSSLPPGHGDLYSMGPCLSLSPGQLSLKLLVYMIYIVYICVYIYICMMCVYIYIYIYIHK